MVWWLELMGLEPSEIPPKSELLWIAEDILKNQPHTYNPTNIK